VSLPRIYETIKDLASQHGYIATIYHGHFEVEKRFVLVPWTPEASGRADLIRIISNDLNSRWCVPVIYYPEGGQPWMRADYRMSVNDYFHFVVSVMARDAGDRHLY
jgi:hypothetical protein